MPPMEESKPEPSRTRVWGIVNVTPDSFSDGGEHATAETAVAHAGRLVEEGADVLDVGGESTRPGAVPVAEDVEIGRVVPVIRALRVAGVVLPVSVDTRKASVADEALRAGATVVNDVSAGTADPAMLSTVARHGAGLVLMHMRGDPATMQRDPRYADVVAEVLGHLLARVEAALAAGVPRARIWIDPGLGFGKTPAHNEALLEALPRFVSTCWPVLVGASRKSFLGAAAGKGPKERLGPSLEAAARAARAGVAAVRVHDVAETVARLAAVRGATPGGGGEGSLGNARRAR